jgi:WD40 repeat protein
MPKTRRQLNKASKTSPAASKAAKRDDDNNDEFDVEAQQQVYAFDGKEYDTYQDMVDAKRKRNHDVLVKSGLIGMSASIKDQAKAAGASQRGIVSKKRKTVKKEPLPRRKSSRIAGVQAEDIYIESESGGKFTISGGTINPGATAGDVSITPLPVKPEYFNGRIAEQGALLSVKDSVNLADSKWIQEDSVETATKFLSGLTVSGPTKKRAAKNASPTSVVPLTNKIDSLSVDDDRNVAKVTPERIYSVACHPSTDKLIVCAGDKQGYVGMWNVDDSSEQGDGVHLFRVHGRPLSCLSWTPSGQSLLLASYDGSVRWLNVETQTFEEIFATYDDDKVYHNHLGSGLDQGYNYWTQYVCPDHRNASDQCFFMSTSDGTAMHVDLRVGKGKLTFHEKLSEKKINTLRYDMSFCCSCCYLLDAPSHS